MRHLRSSLRRFFSTVTVVAMWFGLLSWESARAPGSSYFLGPLYMIWYNGSDVGIWLIVGGLMLGIVLPLLWLNATTVGVSALSLLVWLLLGVTGQGIGD